jgi:hypothetical protein
MEWYKIVIVIFLIPVGAYVRGKFYEFRRDYNKNDSWKFRRKG